MWSVVYVIVFTLSPALWLPADGSSLISGFPSLEDLIRNGSLLERYSTDSEEFTSVPGVRFTCSENEYQISRISYVALPGATRGNISLFFQATLPLLSVTKISISDGDSRFSKFGHELVLNMTVGLNQGTLLFVRHSPYEEGNRRLLYQAGDEKRFVCRGNSIASTTCQNEFNYPLVAIETDPPGCIEGPVPASELRRVWGNRDELPVLYSSPERLLSLNCQSTSLSRILVGAYPSLTGNGVPRILIGDDQTCSVSTEPASGDANVYECVLESPATVNGNVSLAVSQRNAGSKIGFLHNGLTETPLISVDSSGGCSSTSQQILSEADLIEMTTLYIPNITEREGADIIAFQQLSVTQNGILVNWTFVARKNTGQGREYPMLSIMTGNNTFQRPIENTNCTETLYPNVYECSVTPEPVEAGDTIGIVLPARSRAQLLLSFLLVNGGPSGESFITRESVDGLPLASVEIVPFESTTPPPSTSPNEGIIIGVVFSVYAVILTISVLSILTVLWMRRRRRSDSSDNVDDINTEANVAYRRVNSRADTNGGLLGSDVSTTNTASDAISTSDNAAYVRDLDSETPIYMTIPESHDPCSHRAT